MKTQNPGSLWTHYVLYSITVALAATGVYWLFDSAVALLLGHGQTQWLDALLPADEALMHRLIGTGAVVAIVAVSALGYKLQRRLASPVAGLSERMQQVFSAAEDIVLCVDRRGKIIELNEAASARLGCEIVGCSLFEIINVSTNGENSSDYSFQNPRIIARCCNDTQFPAQVSILRITGLPPRYAVTLHDITEQLTAEKALQHSEKKYRSLFENVPDGVYRSLPDGTLLIANAAMVSMLGYNSSDELCSTTNTRDLYRNPEDRSRVTHALREQGKVRNAEFELRRKHDGFITVLANIHAVRDDAADAVVFEGTLSEISDLKNMRGLLNEQAEHFRLYTEHARDIITVLNHEGVIVYSSPASQRVTGFTPASVVNMKVLDRIHPDDRDAVFEKLQRGFQQPGSSHAMTFRIRHRDGSWRYLESVGSAFISGDKRLRAVINSRDVTDRMAKNALAEKAQNNELLRTNRGRDPAGKVSEIRDWE